MVPVLFPFRNKIVFSGSIIFNSIFFREKNRKECTEAATSLTIAADQLEVFVDNPDFAAVPAKISASGEKAQKPILAFGSEMLDASYEMIT